MFGGKEQKEERGDMAGKKEIFGQNDAHVEKLDERVFQANQLWRRIERRKIHGNHAGCDHQRIGLECNQKRLGASAESSNTQH